MVRRFGAVFALVLGGLALGLTGSVAPSLASDRALPMRFELRHEAASAGCGTQCRLLISASGAITADTPADFRNFASGKHLQGATIVLDSDGGSVLGAIAFGREIRALKLATTVGRVIDELPGGSGGKSAVPEAKVLSRADCESMCAFLMLAGVKRSVAPEARVMVHQIWLGDRREDPTAATYSAEDLVLVQRDIGRLAKYTADMGGPADLLELALRIPPWEPMHALTPAELRNMGFETGEKPTVPANAPLIAKIDFTPAQTVGVPADGFGELGWSMVDRAGASVLARRHPLTVEGDEIGGFDLMVACGGGEDYLVTYTEDRQSGPGIAPLTGVAVRIGGQSAPLKVVSSKVQQSGLLATVAAGSVPASLIKAFTAPGNHSMIVDTDAPGLQTSIRVGNAGARSGAPILASRCQKALGARAELPVQAADSVH
jgi:hypothetical protein